MLSEITDLITTSDAEKSEEKTSEEKSSEEKSSEEVAVTTVESEEESVDIEG